MNRLSRTAGAGIAVLCALALVIGGASVAQAATLTTAQVNAIISLLQSFGADQSVINNVQASLTGSAPASSSTTSSTASAYTFTKDLKLGDSGPDVMALQKVLNESADTQVASGSNPGAPGYETSYFGPATKAAVEKFQRKYYQDVLWPAGLYEPNGVVGPSTRAKLNGLVAARSAPPVPAASGGSATTTAPVSSGASAATTTAVSTQTSDAPEVSAVYPTRVRGGDAVTVIGSNFAPTGNMITLGDGPVSDTIGPFPSKDGRTISFVYEPPDVKTMTKQQLLALPPADLAQIEKPLQAAGDSIDDILVPYQGIASESQLRSILAKNGYSFDDLYHFFWITVTNSAGSGMSQTALLHGLEKLPFDTTADAGPSRVFAEWHDRLFDLFAALDPVKVAHAQSSGGFYSIAFVCTCSGAVVTFNEPVGLFVWQPGTVPAAGSCRAAGAWLGEYVPSAGICPMYIGLGCVTLTFNMAVPPLFGCST